jgi:TorA maturation chaperone TorD
MSGLAGGMLPAPNDAEKAIFEKHMVSWIGKFFADLEHAEAAGFYRHVGVLGRVFVEIEAAAFALPD